MAIHLRSLILLLLFLFPFTAILSAADSSPSSSPIVPSPQPSLPSPPQSPSPQSPSPPPIPQRSRRSPRRPSRRPQHPPSPPPPPLTPSPAAEASPDQLNNIIDALIGAGDFGDWVSVVASAVLPLSATLFVPENDGANRLPSAGDPFTFSYHVIPQRLSFSELLLFKTNTHLPTLLPGKSVVITNNSRLNFSINGSPITVPDLYATTAIIVHGVARMFDFSVYGQDGLDPPADQSAMVRPPPAPKRPDGGISESSSDAAPPCLCIEFPAVLVVVCALLGFKTQRNNFR
ncbi:hypothetical protein L484_025934 [Morus notabilis]|uniref:FAS1 domain-containing protein n=1 Tax=Morus notabilis TaxID=981085 RepID=W9R7E8_9ROSA|nr:FAS1 domain-containing protein SELMODRAFT_448915 [Morus notabilis]EXB75156.1 hypothetical protein L484_025934 [Morus notabilis]